MPIWELASLHWFDISNSTELDEKYKSKFFKKKFSV
jgi:hypothetical protein